MEGSSISQEHQLSTAGVGVARESVRAKRNATETGMRRNCLLASRNIIIIIISGNGRPGKSQKEHQALLAGIECQAD